MKTNVDIEILDHRYTIRSDAEEDHVYKIADHLNKRIKEVLQTTKTVDTLNVIILAALNIASEFFRAKDERGELQQRVEDESRELISFIDSQVDRGENCLSNN